MPKVRMPDGVVVAFPDDMPPEQIKGMIASKFPELAAPQPAPVAPPAPSVGVGEDMARSAASGLRSGVESLAGQFGSANQMTGDMAAWLAGKMGVGQGGQDFARNLGRYASPTGFLPSTNEIQAGTNAVMGEGYQPQTTPGKFTRTIAEFAPAAAIGPGGLVRKTAMAVVPGLASEAAGQMTEGTPAEPYARLAGGLVGGGLAAGRNPSMLKMAAKDAPSAETVKAQTDRLYGALRDAGIRYDADSFGTTVLKMATDLKKQGFRPVGRMKEAYDWIDEIAKDVGKSPSFDDINSLRQSIGEAARDAYRSPESRSLGRALDVIKDHLDDFEGGAPLVSDRPIPAEQFNAIRGKARELALRTIKQRALDEVADNADTYQSGRDAGIRNGIGNLLRSKRGVQLFRGDERKALLDVQHGGKALRTLSRFGLDISKLSGNATALPTLGATAAYGALGPLTAGSLIASGTAAKMAVPRLTERALNQAAGAIRSGKMNAQETATNAKALRVQKLIRQLLTSDQALQVEQAHARRQRAPLELTVRPAGQ